MGAVERKGLAFLRVGGMASVEEAISVLGDEGQAMPHGGLGHWGVSGRPGW